MSGFRRDAQGAACFGRTTVRELLERAGLPTPVYVYDLAAIRKTATEMTAALGAQPHVLAYAVKANSAGSIVRLLAELGVGADVVSGGELELVRRAGVAPRKIVMSGVAKTDEELDRAIAEDILAIQVESAEELERVAARARAAGTRARVAIRVNPGIEIDSHAHIATGHDEAKFGVLRADVPAAFDRIDRESESLALVGLSVHVGSMMATPEPYRNAALTITELARVRQAKTGSLEYIDFGGGIGIDYGNAPCEPPAAFAGVARAVLRDAGLSDLMLVMEPGRCLVGPYGLLVARVVGTKVTARGRFLLLDAGMNDLIRPALYGARHRVEPLDWAPGATEYRVVGPVCESADDFGSHAIGDRVPEYVVLRDAGAYSFSMASEYNGRPLPGEIFVDDGALVSVSPGPGREDWIARRLRA